MKPDNKLFLYKMAEFANVAINEIDQLEESLLEFRKQAAADQLVESKYAVSLEKAAKALYDTDFLTDDIEKRRFLKEAKADPSYLAKVLIKVCEAADVAQIGYPARVAKVKAAEIEDDPVMRRAFGTGSSNFLEDVD